MSINLSTAAELEALSGETEFSHIPDWYEWERENVRAEIERRDLVGVLAARADDDDRHFRPLADLLYDVNAVSVHDNSTSFGAIVKDTRSEVALLVTPASDTTQ